MSHGDVKLPYEALSLPAVSMSNPSNGAKEGYVGIEIEQVCGFGKIGSVLSAPSVLIRNHLFTHDVYQKLRLLQFDGQNHILDE